MGQQRWTPPPGWGTPQGPQPPPQPPPPAYGQPGYGPPPPGAYGPPPGYGPPAGYGQPAYRGPARSAHGPGYWVLAGWWLEPTLWAGRMVLWVLFWPVGLWRTVRKGRRNREARERRGWS